MGAATSAFLVGAALASSLSGQYVQGRAEKKAQIRNAEIQEKEAQNADAVSAYEEYKARRQKERITSSQRAAYAKSGVSLSGSPLDLISADSRDMELDILATKYNYGIQRNRSLSAAGLYRRGASNVQTGMYLGMSNTIFSTAANVASTRGIGGTNNSGTVTGVRSDGTKIKTTGNLV